MKDDECPKPKGWRVSLSIGMGVGWLIFVILWLAFYAGNYNGYQNFAIILISILVIVVVLGGSWATWGLKHCKNESSRFFKMKGFKSRVVVSIAIPFILIIFWIYWFFFIAEDYNFYQNIAIFLVSILAIGGILGGMWAPWGMKHEKELEELDEKK